MSFNSLCDNDLHRQFLPRRTKTEPSVPARSLRRQNWLSMCIDQRPLARKPRQPPLRRPARATTRTRMATAPCAWAMTCWHLPPAQQATPGPPWDRLGAGSNQKNKEGSKACTLLPQTPGPSRVVEEVLGQSGSGIISPRSSLLARRAASSRWASMDASDIARATPSGNAVMRSFSSLIRRFRAAILAR